MFNKIKESLKKTSEKFFNSLTEIVTGKAVLDEEKIDMLEAVMLQSDFGAEITDNMIERIRVDLKAEKIRDNETLITTAKNVLKESLILDKKATSAESAPHVILIVGVNGVGKTTTLGKLANLMIQEGKKVLIVAGDTFRAAANEQLEIWAKRSGAAIFSNYSKDPASVIYDALEKTKTEKFDYVLIDTAGRLHNKKNLMEELSKIKTVIKKQIPSAPHDILLIIDANNGQNALRQAEEFNSLLELTGFIVTKLDGTAKGGIIFNICSRFKIPIKYIGVGEGTDDLLKFNQDDFINSFFEEIMK